MNAHTTLDHTTRVMNEIIAGHRPDMTIEGLVGMMIGVMMIGATMTGAMMTAVTTTAATMIVVIKWERVAV